MGGVETGRWVIRYWISGSFVLLLMLLIVASDVSHSCPFESTQRATTCSGPARVVSLGPVGGFE